MATKKKVAKKKPIKEKIRIGFSKPRNKIFPIFSWAIRLIERTPYSHVYVQWNASRFDETLVYEASGSSVHFTGKDIFSKKNTVIAEFEFDISEKSKFDLVKWSMHNSGTKYGVVQIIGIAYVKFMCLFDKKVNNPFSDNETSQVCSELTGYILRDFLGYDIQQDLDIAGPKAIFNFIQGIKSKKTIINIK